MSRDVQRNQSFIATHVSVHIQMFTLTLEKVKIANQSQNTNTLLTSHSIGH